MMLQLISMLLVPHGGQIKNDTVNHMCIHALNHVKMGKSVESESDLPVRIHVNTNIQITINAILRTY
jgi:hypothetical protein